MQKWEGENGQQDLVGVGGADLEKVWVRVVYQTRIFLVKSLYYALKDIFGKLEKYWFQQFFLKKKHLFKDILFLQFNTFLMHVLFFSSKYKLFCLKFVPKNVHTF